MKTTATSKGLKKSTQKSGSLAGKQQQPLKSAAVPVNNLKSLELAAETSVTQSEHS